MPEFIVFVSPKGGTGASFVCAGIWHAFAKKAVRVLAVDLCGKRSALDFALGFQNDSVYNVSDVSCGLCQLEDALCYSENFENAYFLRGSSDDEINFESLKKILSKTNYEYILIDAQPDEKIYDILDMADKVLVVTECTDVSVRICEAFSQNLTWDRSYTVINKIIPSYIENGFMPNLDEITDGIGLRPLGLIPWSPDAVMLYSGKQEKFTDKSIAAAFSNIASRIMGDSVPAIDFKTNYECFKTKKRR